MKAPPRCEEPERHETAWRTREGRVFCQTCELWKVMISVSVWEGGSPKPENTRQRTATVGALTIEELRQQLPWAIANVLRAADLEHPDECVEAES